jgi:hypothetical protein
VPLLDFQTALGRAVQTSPAEDPLCGLDFTADERARVAALVESAGFRFTVDVQRSWSVGRAAKAARLTLSILAPEERRQLLDEWVSNGGGTASFFAAEADAFLEFIAERQPNPSHALTICRVEQATLRASEGSRYFRAPDLSRLDAPGCLLAAGRYAALVQFYAEPHRLLAALDGQPLPPLSPQAISMLFGPGLDGLFREATDEEVTLWERLVEPAAFKALLQEGHRRDIIEGLTVAGAAEWLSSDWIEKSHPMAAPG